MSHLIQASGLGFIVPCISQSFTDATRQNYDASSVRLSPATAKVVDWEAFLALPWNTHVRATLKIKDVRLTVDTSEVTICIVNFYYSTDDKRWRGPPPHSAKVSPGAILANQPWRKKGSPGMVRQTKVILSWDCGSELVMPSCVCRVHACVDVKLCQEYHNITIIDVTTKTMKQ